MGTRQFAPEAWLPFFEWLENTAIGTVVRESIWAFPIIEAVHLLGLGLLGGALLLVDLRLWGTGLTRQPIASVVRHAHPWLLAGVGLMFATGIPLFLSEAVKCYYNTSFRVKMISLPVALAFTFGARKWVVTAAPSGANWRTRLIAFISLGLWFTVAAAGRWIGFSA
ncbi:DUF6644 family protein [Candidatus Palauibacter sp.]|uniref:DUF6644 family protein n=1 Tax=Candidatus Palauibacter sp. TaxID=3101350 RepID=UPI003B5B5A0F